MPKFGGIVDSYARYVPIADVETAVAPSFDRVPLGDGAWGGVDEQIDGEAAEGRQDRVGSDWSPSVCTSDGGIEAVDEDAAADELLRRHDFAWPDEIDGWRLRSVRREVVMDDEKADA